MNKEYLSGMVLLVLSLFSLSLPAATLDVRDGVLYGATGVIVDGLSYDVSFGDGSCISLFSGCDESSDFVFTDPAQSIRANLAILEQVLIDGPDGLFDSNPGLTNGCYATSDCFITSPVAAAPSNMFVATSIRNRSGALADVGTGYGSGPTRDWYSGDWPDFAAMTRANQSRTFMVWHGETASTVPIPGAIWLFCTALVSTIGIAHKDRT